MHFPDLGTTCQIARGPRVRAVGWLADGHDFSQGPLDERVASKAMRLAEDGWVHAAVAGFHTCELCADAREGRNILVPDADVLYVAPAMIVHYMRAHAYAPPPAFCSAVLACPEPETDAYYAALRRFVDVFSSGVVAMTAEQFDHYAREHRAWRAQIKASRIAAAERKGFTW